MSDLTLNLRLRVNADGSAEVINNTRRSVDNLRSASDSLHNSFAKLAAQALAGLGMAQVASDILRVNREMESLRMQLQAVTGSGQAAQRTFEQISKMASSTPFEIGGLTKSFITLQNFGIRPTAQVMDALTNQAAKLGGSQETLSGITLALGQAYSKGKLQAEEMNQLIERSVPVYDLLAKATGEDASALLDMAEKGELTREVIDKLILKMGEMASGSNAAAMDTLNGKISNLSDAWHTFEDTLLNDKSEGYIKRIVESAGALLNLLSRNMSDTLDNQIAKSEAKIKTYNGMNSVAKGVTSVIGFVGTFGQDYSIDDEKEKLASLRQLKVAQDLADAKIEINEKSAYAIKQTNDWLAEMESADTEKAVAATQKSAKEKERAASHYASAAESAAQKYADAINNEIAALNDQHLKLSLTERDYELSKLAALGMSDAVKTASIAVWDSNKALEAQKAGIEAGVSAMDAEIERYNKLTQSVNEYKYSQLLLAGVSPGNAVEIVAESSVNDGIDKQQKSIDDAWKSLESYNSTIDSTKASMSDLGQVTSAVFDGALGGFSLMVGALEKMADGIKENAKEMEALAKRRQEIDAIQPDASKGFTAEYIKQVKTKAAADDKWYEDAKELEEKQLRLALNSARQIAGAASKMFGEKTAAAQAFHGLEIALGIASMAMEAKKVVVYVAGIIPKLAAGAATMFAQSGWGGFAGVAAMGAVMAGLGYGMMSNPGASSEPPKMSPDTGTVLGDSTAKSESIDKTYQLLQDIHADEYAELRGINAGIAGLSSGITDVITRLFQAGGLKDFATMPTSKQSFGMVGNAVQMGAMLGSGGLAKFDPIANAVLGFLFGGKQTSSVTGQGLTTGATSISDIMAGGNLSAQQFATIETKTKGGIFGKDKTAYSQQFAAVDAGTQKALNDVFKSMGTTMIGLADNLGMGLSDRVKNYIIPALNIDLKGLDGEAAAKKLNGVVSSTLDTMSTAVFGDILGKYQKLGEGMLETAVRMVAEVAVVRDALTTSGLSIGGDAIAISDALVQASGGLQEFQKQFEDYYDKFFTAEEKQVRLSERLHSQVKELFSESDINVLAKSRDGYKQVISAMGQINDSNREQYSWLIKNADAADSYYGYLEEAAKKAADAAAAALKNLYDKFATPEEKFQMLSSQLYSTLSQSFNDETISKMAKSRDGLREVYLALDATSAADKERKTMIENAADAIATYYTYLEDGAKKSVQDAEKAAADSAKAASTAFSVLQKSVESEKAKLTSAYNDAIKLTQSAIDNLSSSVSRLSSISSTLKNAVNRMSMPGNDAIERQQGQAFIGSALMIARLNGTLPDEAALNKALDAVSKPSENLFSTFADYQRDFYATANDIRELSGYAQSSLDYETEHLNALKAQLEATKSGYEAEISRLDNVLKSGRTQVDAVNGSTLAVLSVTDAIAALATAIDAQSQAQTIANAARNEAAGTIDSTTAAAASAAWTAQGYWDKNPDLQSYWNNMDWGDKLSRYPDGRDQFLGHHYQNYGVKEMRKFAAGGDHGGGWRMVGENGPEVEYTPPSHIYSNSQSKSLVDNSELIAEMKAEMKALRDEIKLLRASTERGNENTQRSADILAGRQSMPLLVQVVTS